jgi:hypothetical protein
MTMTGKWTDPNNPNAGSTSPGFEDKDMNKIPDYLQAENTVPGVQDTPTSTTDDYSTRTKKRGLEDETQIAIRQGERDVRRSTRKAMRQDPDAFYEGEPQEGMTAPMSDADYMARVNANRQAAIDARIQNAKLPLEYPEPDVNTRATTVGAPQYEDDGTGREIPESSTQQINPMDYMSRSLSLSGQPVQRPTAENMDVQEGTSTFDQNSPYEPEDSMYPYLERNPGYAFGGSTLDKFIGGGNPMGPNAFDPNTDSGGNQLLWDHVQKRM